MDISLNTYLHNPHKYEGYKLSIFFDNEWRKILKVGTQDGKTIQLEIKDPYWQTRMLNVSRNVTIKAQKVFAHES